MKIRTVNFLSQGSLGKIYRDVNGRLYTKEYNVSRYWFVSKKDAKDFIFYIIKTPYFLYVEEICISSLEPTLVRGEWTVAISENLRPT